MKLQFTVDKQQLHRTDDEIIASYSKNFIRCEFKCKCMWSDIYKYALFVDVKGEKFIVDLGYGKKVQCRVPSEVLKGNYFLVSIFGANRLTTTQETILIQPSGFTDSVEDLLESDSFGDLDVISTSSDVVEDDRPKWVTCFHGYSILKNPQHDEHLYYY